MKNILLITIIIFTLWMIWFNLTHEHFDQPKINIAILITGRLTNNRRFYDNMMDKLVGNNNADIFICHAKDAEPETVNTVHNTYKPKRMMPNDENFNRDILGKYPTTNEVDKPYNCMSMHQSRKLVMNMLREYMKESGTKYDVIICTRMDYEYHTSMAYDYLLPKTTENILCIPDGYDYFGINDQLAVGNEKSMTTYTNLVDHIPEYLEAGLSKFTPESLLKVHFEKCGQTINRFHLGYNIIRSPQF